MIQDFSLNIKSAFNSFDFKFLDEPDFDTVERIETYCLNNINVSSCHTHDSSVCKSSNLVYFRSYSRHYVSFRDNVQYNMITIPVLYCKNDRHYHAVLPNSIIVPYSSFSIFFILKVLSLKSCSAFTVEKLVEIFHISTSTLYRWISKYNAYLRVFNTFKNRYHMHFFIHLIYDFSNVVHDIFDFNLHTLFQYDRTLFNHDP